MSDTIDTAHAEPIACPPGRAYFHEALRAECRTLIGRVVREQLSHGDYLDAREQITRGAAWRKSQAGARTQAFAYLEGAIDMLWAARTLVWKHRVGGAWIPSPLPQGADYSAIEVSAHVWADSNKPFLPPSKP